MTQPTHLLSRKRGHISDDHPNILRPKRSVQHLTVLAQPVCQLSVGPFADPYLNTDAGTMSPFEHGEVFVLDDGGEVRILSRL